MVACPAVRRRIRVGLAVLSVALLSAPCAWAAASGQATTSSFGGTPVADPSLAPWSVLVGPPPGKSGNTCTGSITDAAHVLTAAHCVFVGPGQPLAPSALTVYAGASSFTQGADQDELQSRGVVNIRAFPSYAYRDLSGDVALLEVSPPFSLGGPGVQPIPVVREGGRPAVGNLLRTFGFGLFADGQGDGVERYLDQQRIAQWRCASGAPSVLCTLSPSGSPCKGDSGGGVVTPTSPPVLLGVSNITFNAVGEAACAPGHLTVSADLSSPEIHRWLEGSEQPPRAPRSSFRAALSRPPVAGERVACVPPKWEESPTSLATAFVDMGAFKILARGSARYVPRPSQVGRLLACVSIATNGGGTTEAVSEPQRIRGAPGRLRSSSTLAKLTKRKRTRNGWKLVFRISPPLIGRSATARWSSQGCKACYSREVVPLHRRTVLHSPPTARGRRVDLRFLLPAIGGTDRYRSGVIHRRLGP